MYIVLPSVLVSRESCKLTRCQANLPMMGCSPGHVPARGSPFLARTICHFQPIRHRNKRHREHSAAEWLGSMVAQSRFTSEVKGQDKGISNAQFVVILTACIGYIIIIKRVK